MGKFAISWKIC